MNRAYDYLGNGLGPIPGLVGQGGLVAFPVECFQTPVLDLTVPNLGIELIPAKPGHAPIGFGTIANFLIELVAGTQTSQLSARAGSDAGHTNFFSLTAGIPSNADVNGAVVPSLGGTLIGVNTLTQLIPNSPVLLDITIGAAGTGGFRLRGKVTTICFWLPVG